MIRRRPGLTLLIACAALTRAGAAQQSGAGGAIDWFGRGIVEVGRSGTEIHLELRTGAQGMLLRLAPGEPITIVAVGPFAAGESVVRLQPALPAERLAAATEHSPTIAVSTDRQAPRLSSPTRDVLPEYLLLVLSDRAPDSIAIGRIRSIPGFDAATAPHD